MSWFTKFALAASILMTLLGGMGTAVTTELYFQFQHPSPAMKLVFCIGWVIWTYGPIVIAALFWRWSKSVRFPWVPHLLLLPCIWAVTVGSQWLMLFAIDQRDFDDTLGGPVMAGLFLTLIGIAGYIVAVITRWVLLADRRPVATDQSPDALVDGTQRGA